MKLDLFEKLSYDERDELLSELFQNMLHRYKAELLVIREYFETRCSNLSVRIYDLERRVESLMRGKK